MAEQEVRSVRVGGVPEHFNAPWHLANAKDAFNKHGVKVEWQDFPGGTGDMCKAVSEGTVDVAIMLTEGTIAHALKDPNVKVIGVYVSTSAIWGIHAGAKSCESDDIKDMKDSVVFAISRFGSGSHLMAYVLAESMGWEYKGDALNFKVVGGLKGACEELPKDGSLVFMWEKFTTLPWVVDGTFKRIGEFPTPWPFFSIAVNSNFINQPHAKQDVENILSVVKAEAEAFKSGGEETLAYIKENYKIENEPASEWLPTVTWACEPKVDLEMLEGVAKTLHRVGKIETESGDAPSAEDIQNTVVSITEPSSKKAKTADDE